MNIELQLTFLRHEEHVHAGIDALAQEVLSDFTTEIEAKTSCQASLRISVPKPQDYFVRDHALGTAAPRLWADIRLQAEVVFDLETYHQRRCEPNELLDPAIAILSRFVGAMDDLLPPRVLAANISAPGVLSLIGGVLVVDQHRICSAPQLENCLLDVLDDGRTLGWPKEILVTYPAAREWVSRIMSKSPRTASSQVSRALAAYSYIATANSFGGGDLQLFWAMMGLEALYCDGNEGLKKQLFDKASVVFGPLSENRKRIRGLYDFRSAFVHGSLEIPYSFTTGYDEKTVEAFQSDLFGAESVAFLLLVASLQFLVSKDLDDLDFRYVLADREGAVTQLKASDA